MLGYPIELTPDDKGTFLVTCPDLGEAFSASPAVQAGAVIHGGVDSPLPTRLSPVIPAGEPG